MRVPYFLSDSLIIGLLKDDQKCLEILMRMDPDNLGMIPKNLGMIPKNCKMYLERYISEGYKDVAQLVLIAILNQRDNPKMQDHPGAFSTTINKRKIIDALRKYKRSKEIPDSCLSMYMDGKPEAGDSWMNKQICEDPSPMVSMIEKELVGDQKELLKRLLDMIFESDDSTLKGALKSGRMALIYQIRDKLSIDKIAEIMKARNGTVKSWISRYREHLRQELGRQGWDQSRLREVMGF